MKKMFIYFSIITLLFITLCSCNIGGGNSNINREGKIKVVLQHKNGTKNSILYLDKGMIITTLQEPMLEGYLFKGWYNGEEKWNIQESPVIEDMTLTAKYIQIHKDSDFSYILNEDNKSYCLIEIIDKSEEITIPESYKGKPITKIKLFRRANCSSLYIPDCISEIDPDSYNFFYNSSRTKLIFNSTNPYFKTINNSVYSKDETILYKYRSEDGTTFGYDFKVPDTVKVISSYALSGVGNLTLPEGLTTICSFAFAYGGIRSIIIPKNVNYIDGSAFLDCGIEKITVDENNNYYYSSGEALYTKDQTKLIKFCSPKNYIDFIIPLTVKEISPYAFARSLVNELSIPANVEKIHYTNFYLLMVKSIIVDENNNYFSSVNNDLYTKDHKTILKMSRNTALTVDENKILDTVTTIGNYAVEFGLVKSLVLPDSIIIIGDGHNRITYANDKATILLPKNITIVGDYALYPGRIVPYIENLDELVSIGDYAFANDTPFNRSPLMYSIIFSDNSRLTLLGEYAFARHMHLEKVVLPKSLKYITDYLFDGCLNLEDVTIPSGVIYISSTAFNETKFKQ